MITSPLWKNLKLLVRLDQKKESIFSQIKEIEQNIEENKKILPQLQETIDQIKLTHKDAKKNVDLQELHAKYLKEQESEKRKALTILKKQKEYAAVEHELNSLIQQINEQDDILIQAWHNLETSQKKEADEIPSLEEKITLLQADINEKENQITTQKQLITNIDQQVETESKNIPAEWLIQYQRMRNKVPDPIVPILNNSCSACYYSVPSQDIVRLKRNAILPCRSCYRFLYYDKDEEEDLSKANF